MHKNASFPSKVILTQSKTNSGMWNSHHVNESNVKKHASCQHENPGGDFVHAANSNADHHPAKAENARQNVIEESHLDGHASLKQYRKISWKENKNTMKYDTIYKLISDWFLSKIYGIKKTFKFIYNNSNLSARHKFASLKMQKCFSKPAVFIIILWCQICLETMYNAQ